MADTAGIVGGRGASSKLSWAALIPVDKPHGLRGIEAPSTSKNQHVVPISG